MNPSYFQAQGKQGRSLNGLARYTDVVLVLALVAIIALMIVPLPAWMIDLLVAVNIAGGLLLLLLAVYVTNPLEFSVFPSVLLISTLFRLALSIATTRMILLHGEAGHIIDTFGNMVAGGNLVVGLVVFLIITVVQFIVIAKGSERVAEVAARFSLDAMPGKQLSIDSDLRSGLIDKDEARRRRSVLEAESRLNGSLDGAMKFVKGDAIAGIIIILINLVGGLAVGVMQQSMSMGEAAVKYSILTIGDGMVTQIPALLGAMSAGLLVTRTTGNEGENLGQTMGAQMMANPKVLMMAGGLCCLFALVPGFPVLVFLALAFGFGAAGALMTPVARAKWERFIRPAVSVVTRREATAPVLMTAAASLPRPTVPLLLEISRTALSSDNHQQLVQALERMLEGFQLHVGLQLPRIDVHMVDDPEAKWQLLGYEVPLASGLCGEAGYSGIVQDVTVALRRHAGMFLGTQEASLLLTRAALDLPDVVKETLRSLPLARVAEVFRRLVEEEIAIRNMRDILETLSDAAQREKDVNALVELTRIGLKRQTCHRIAPDGQLRAVLLEPALEEALRGALRVNGGVEQLALDPGQITQLMAYLKTMIEQLQPAALVTAVDIRRHVRKLVETDCFATPVLSYHELVPSLQLDVLARLGGEGAPRLAG